MYREGRRRRIVSDGCMVLLLEHAAMASLKSEAFSSPNPVAATLSS
jgi:hypothetical protein